MHDHAGHTGGEHAPTGATPRTTSTPATPSRCSATSSGSRSLLTIPTLIWGHMLPRAARLHAAAVPGRALDPAGARHRRSSSTAARPFLQGAWRELRARLPGHDDADRAGDHGGVRLQRRRDARAIPGMPLWEELATLVTIMLLGHWIEMRSISQAQGALARAGQAAAGQRRARVPAGRRAPRRCRSTALREGDLVLVRPGAGVPADGVVRDGPQQRQRVDDHRRVAAGREARRARR